MDLLQIIGFGVLTLIPIHKLFECSYLGTVESKINNFTYDKVKKYFFFDYYNLNPIEEIETQIERISKEVENVAAEIPSKKIKNAERKRNAIISDNFLIKAMYELIKYFNF